MIVFNKKDSVYISADQNSEYIGKTYSIFKTNQFDCIVSDSIETGIVNKDFNVILEDGKYVLFIYGEELTDLQINFIVFYNNLPELISKLKQIFCPCSNCENNEKNMFLLMFEMQSYINCIGLDKQLKLINILNCKNNKKLQLKKEHEKIYNNFNFSYEESIKQYLATLYLELYLTQKESLKEINEDTFDIDCIFQINTLKNCLYNMNIDFEEIEKEYKNLNCNCYE